MTAKTRDNIHRLIVGRLLADALTMGYGVNINNGGDTMELPEPSTDQATIEAAMFATHDEHLYFYRGKVPVGWVYLVYVNSGWDVICDYNEQLEDVLAGANRESERWS